MVVSMASFCILRSMSVLLMMTSLSMGGVAAAVVDKGFRSPELSGFIASAPWMLLLASSLFFFFFFILYIFGFDREMAGSDKNNPGVIESKNLQGTWPGFEFLFSSIGFMPFVFEFLNLRSETLVWNLLFLFLSLMVCLVAE